MSESKNAVKDTANATADELKSLIREAEEALSSVKDGTNLSIEDLRARLRSAVDDGKTLVDNMKHAIQRQAGRADDTIRANPYQSIGIAAGVGLVVGLLISRRCGSQNGS